MRKATCTWCKQEKDVSEFRLSRYVKKDGTRSVYSHCRSCESKRALSRYERVKDTIEHKTSKRAYDMPGMTWDNYGEWHIDHIKPQSLFDFTNPNDIKACWALSNLQPLWASENLSKRNRYFG